MASKSSFDSTLSEFRGVADQYAGRDVGVEVELEGTLLPNAGVYWHVKPEASLRDGGMEYIFKKPLAIAEVPKALAAFEATMKKCSPHASIRCSTHIHINVMNFTIREIYNAMAAHYLIEDALIETQKPNRHGNLFALSMSRAEDIFQSIQQSLNTQYVNQFIVERNRYAALNLAALNKYGSLEFRFLDAYTDAASLQLWVDIFYNLVNNGRRIGPRQLLDMYNDNDSGTFLSGLIGPAGAKFLKSKYDEEGLRKRLHTNYDYVFELSKLLERKRFQMPQMYWREDGEIGEKVSFNPFAQGFAEEGQVAVPTAQGFLDPHDEGISISLLKATYGKSSGALSHAGYTVTEIERIRREHKHQRLRMKMLDNNLSPSAMGVLMAQLQEHLHQVPNLPHGVIVIKDNTLDGFVPFPPPTINQWAQQLHVNTIGMAQPVPLQPMHIIDDMEGFPPTAPDPFEDISDDALDAQLDAMTAAVEAATDQTQPTEADHFWSISDDPDN